MTITPGDLRARLTQDRRRQPMAADIITREDIARFLELIQVLFQVQEVPRDARKGQKRNVSRLITEAGERLEAIAADPASDNLIKRIWKVWVDTFKIKPGKNDRPRLGELSKSRIRTVIDLVERARRLLAANCPEKVDVDETAATVVEKAATVVRIRDINLLRTLAGHLTPTESPDGEVRRRRAIEAIVPKIWGRLLETAATQDQGEDPTLLQLLKRWGELYALRSGRVEVSLQELVDSREAVTDAGALVQDTIEFLNSRRPDEA